MSLFGIISIFIFSFIFETSFGFTLIKRVGVYEVYEQAFELKNISLKDDVWKNQRSISVTFVKGKDSITMPCFWAGRDVWKFRMSFPAIGIWSWKINTDLPNLNNINGKIEVINSVNKGFVCRNPDYPHSVSYSKDKTPVFVWGNTGYDIIVQALEGNEPVWQKFIDSSSYYGMNKVRMLVTMWNFGPSKDRKYYPWKNCSLEHPHFDVFNTNYWDALDRIVQYMQRKGMIADLILFPDSQALHNMTLQDEKRYLRYIIARYAAYTNVIWCIANEWNINTRKRYEGINDFLYFNPENPNLEGHVPMSWVDSLGSYLYTNDPYLSKFQRLTSVHNSGNHGKKVAGKNIPYRKRTYHDYKFLFSGRKWVTYDVIQYHDPAGAIHFPGNQGYGDDWGHYGIAMNWDDSVPVFNDEYGYEGHRDWRGALTTADKSRKAGWGIAISGGYGSWGLDFRGDFTNSAGALYGVWDKNAKTPEAIKIMTGIMKHVNFWKMKLNDTLIISKPIQGNAYLYADPGNQYLMYVANGGYKKNFILSLKEGTYSGKWLNTTSGDIIKEVPSFTMSLPGNKTLTSPDFSQNGDVVLKLVNEYH